MNVTTAGIDLARNVFSVHGVDSHGKVALKKTVSRGKLLEFFTNLPPCICKIEEQTRRITAQAMDDERSDRGAKVCLA